MKQAKEFIIFPLDVPTAKEAERYISLLSGHVGMFKVGLELFIRSGPDIVRRIHEYGETGVFLDLKLHDIPATVFRAMASVAKLGASFVTVHCGESKAMLEAAVSGGNGKVGVLGVTVLTSVSGEDLRVAGFPEQYHRDVSKLVLKRAEMARQAGCSGIVCSGREARSVKEHFGREFLAVTPGIRPAYSVTKDDDQQRVVTPEIAVNDGSDYLVIGRPIRDAKDPKAAAMRIAEEIEHAK